MAKPKIKRSMEPVEQAQHVTEKTTQDKFKLTEELAAKPMKAYTQPGRLSPQISCTVAPEDKEKLSNLTLFLSNKMGRTLNTSTVIRALIALGEKKKDELEI